MDEKTDQINEFYPEFSILSNSAQSSVFDNDTQGQVIKGYGFAFNGTNWFRIACKKALFFLTLFSESDMHKLSIILIYSLR